MIRRLLKFIGLFCKKSRIKETDMYIHLNKRYLCVCVDPRAQDRSVGFLQDMGRELHDEIEHMKSVMLDLEAVLTGVYVCVCVYVCERGRYGVRAYDGFEHVRDARPRSCSHLCMCMWVCILSDRERDLGRELHDEIEHTKSVMLDVEAVLTLCGYVYVCERGGYRGCTMRSSTSHV